MSQTVLCTPSGHCRLGLAAVDITPPSDAYHRNWGAALHDAAAGIHRHLRATAMVLQPADRGLEHLLVAVDLGWLSSREMGQLLIRLAAVTGADQSRLVVTFSHTHSAVNLDLTRTGEPGGQHIAPYLEALPGRIAGAVEAARARLQPAVLTYARGRCSLAMQRDYWDAERRISTCGPNPQEPADDTLWVVRCADLDGAPLAYLVNYACHPTTLAWTNRLISPDYVGAMRELVEQTTQVPCLFALGACGDLGPRDGFVGDPSVADRNGRQLGYAVLQTVESMPPPGTEMRYGGPVISGATLGIWEHRPFPPERLPALRTFRSVRLQLELPFRELPAAAAVAEQLRLWQAKEEAAGADGRDLEVRDCRARVERLRRLGRRLEELPATGQVEYEIHLWQIGEGVLVMVGGEPYNLFQRTLRQRFPETPILVAVLCNRPHSYILPGDQYGRGLYQDECSVLAPGSLELIIDAIAAQLRSWNLR
jgi:hypothetical protein